MSAPQLFVGVDVAKAQLDIAVRPTGERWAVANDDAGMATLVARLQAIQPTLMVFKATGGYQRAVVAALGDDLDTTLRASPVWREREELLRSVPDSGPGCARILRLDLPELGTLSRQRLAALVGVAPLNRDRAPSGAAERSRGDAPLSMSTLVAVRYNAVLKAFYERLRTTSKAAKVALTACMRKLLTILNAMVKHHTPWQPQGVLGA